MTPLPTLPQGLSHKCFAEPPTAPYVNFEELSDEERRQIVDKEYEELVKRCKELYGTDTASKDDSAAGPSSSSKPNKVTKPKAKKTKKFPIEEVIARLTQAAQHDPEARKILEKIWHGP